jgi:hypothetical protein
MNFSESQIATFTQHPQGELVAVALSVSKGAVYVHLHGLVRGVRYELQYSLEHESAVISQAFWDLLLPAEETEHVASLPLSTDTEGE